MKILELEDKINKLSFQEKKQEPKKDEPKKEEIVETNQIPTFEMSPNRLNDFENEIVNQNTNAVMEVISKLANTLPPECNKDFLTNIAFNLAKDIGNLSIDSVNTFRNQDSSSESNIINDDNNNSHQNELNKITKEVNIIIDKESNKN